MPGLGGDGARLTVAREPPRQKGGPAPSAAVGSHRWAREPSAPGTLSVKALAAPDPIPRVSAASASRVQHHRRKIGTRREGQDAGAAARWTGPAIATAVQRRRQRHRRGVRRESATISLPSVQSSSRAPGVFARPSVGRHLTAVSLMPSRRRRLSPTDPSTSVQTLRCFGGSARAPRDRGIDLRASAGFVDAAGGGSSRRLARRGPPFPRSVDQPAVGNGVEPRANGRDVVGVARVWIHGVSRRRQRAPADAATNAGWPRPSAGRAGRHRPACLLPARASIPRVLLLVRVTDTRPRYYGGGVSGPRQTFLRVSSRFPKDSYRGSRMPADMIPHDVAAVPQVTHAALPSRVSVCRVLRSRSSPARCQPAWNQTFIPPSVPPRITRESLSDRASAYDAERRLIAKLQDATSRSAR